MPTVIPAHKGVLIFLILMMNGIAFAQHWENPASRFFIWEVNKATGEREDLYTFLERDIPTESNCSTFWGTFFFRVTGTGKIDSLFHQGNLKQPVVSKVNKNIYSTQGHWKVPKGTKPADTYWFVFSYFDFGPYWYDNPASKCSESEKSVQKSIVELAESMSTIRYYLGARKAYFLNPSKIGAEYSKE
jgi:hypothetical protein